MKIEDSHELGIGVVYSPRLARVLDLGLVDVLEIEPQAFWYSTGDPQEPIRVDLDFFSQLRAMPQHKLVHSVTLPVGNSRPHDPRALEQLRQSIVATGAPYATEHLSFNHFDTGTDRPWTGFLLPPKQDEHAVAIAAARIDEMRSAVGVPVAFETGVNYLRSLPGELSDGCFIRSVAESADCGILLDLHNLLTNERNGRDCLARVLEEIPLERVWEIHLAGGMEYRGYWLDSHSSHIEDKLFSLTQAVVDACPNLRAIVFEIMDAQLAASSRNGLHDDVSRLRSLWEARRRPRVTSGTLPPRQSRTRLPDVTTVQRHENTLGALTLGLEHVPYDADRALLEDPAGTLYADLVASMREGVLYDTLPFLFRLLPASIGAAAMMDLIAGFAAAAPPELFGADEARRFISHVRSRDLTVPHLTDILNFEEALIGTTGTLATKTVTFECNPAALFESLEKRRFPVNLPRERFRVVVSPNGIEVQEDHVSDAQCA
jgi:uncharacterized protein